MTTAADVLQEVTELRNLWSGRDAAILKHYRMIGLYNDLYQEKMESVIGTDPRTGYNMAVWLLQPRAASFLVDTTNMTEKEALSVGPVQSFCDKQLALIDKRTRGGLFGPFSLHLLRLLLATGWYSFISIPTQIGWSAQVWNPASVYPDYDDAGRLIRVARVYTVSAKEAQRKAVAEGWSVPLSFPKRGPVTISSVWWLRMDGVWHSAVMGNELVKPPELAPFLRIPIYVAPAAGLPDNGAILKSAAWRAEVGQSVVAPIADLQKNYDKMLTYMQQLLRDTANPRWQENAENPVAEPDKLFERGALFSYKPGEQGLSAIPTPPIPAEMRGHQLDIRSMLQRGLFSDVTFGNVSMQISGFLMSQVTSASQQILAPFHDALMTALGDLATANILFMRQYGMQMPGAAWPDLPDELDIDYHYDIQIPGDFIQRANTARLLNPKYRLSQTTLTELLFPEIKSSMIESSRLVAEDAIDDPLARQVFIIREFRRSANEARTVGDKDFAERLELIARMKEQQLLGSAGQLPEPSSTQRVPAAFGELLRGEE